MTFFRTLGGTVGVAAMGSILGSVVAANITSGIGGLAPEQQLQAANSLGSGAIPQISLLPDFLRVVVESAYGTGVGSVFLAAVPLTIITLIAVIFLPNTDLGTQNAIQRAGAEQPKSGQPAASELERELEQAGEELLEVSEGSVAVPVTGAVPAAEPSPRSNREREYSITERDET